MSIALLINKLFVVCINSCVLLGASALTLYLFKLEPPKDMPEFVETSHAGSLPRVSLLKNNIDDSQYTYLIVEYKSSGKASYPSPEFTDLSCQFEESFDLLQQHKGCLIYKLSESADNQTILDIAATDNDSNIIKQKDDLFLDNYYLLKVYKTFADKLRASSNKLIDLSTSLDVSTELTTYQESRENIIATFRLIVDLDTDQQSISRSKEESNLFIGKLYADAYEGEDIDSTVYGDDDSFTCKFVQSIDPIDCNIYKISSSFLSRNSLNTPNKVTKHSDFVKGRYVLIELPKNKKVFSFLNGHIEIFDKDKKKASIAYAQQLAVAEYTKDVPSRLFLVKKPPIYAKNKPIDATSNLAYLLTRSVNYSSLPDVDSFDPNQFICRVLDNQDQYEDDKCRLFKFNQDNGFAFKPLNYISSSVSTSSANIVQLTDLKDGLFQVLEVNKKLQEILNTKPSARLLIVNKDHKDDFINNKLVELVKEYDFTINDDAFNVQPKQVKTNLFLARLDTKDKGLVRDDKGEYECIWSDTSINGSCKIYKFIRGKTSNDVSVDEIASLEEATDIHDLLEGSYYVVELISDRKSFYEFKNKKLKVHYKGDGTKKLNFSFAQTLYGKATGVALPLEDEMLTYIVQVAGDNLNIDNTFKSYLCKYKKANQPYNYDHSCKIEAIKPQEGKQIVSLSELLNKGEAIPKEEISSFLGDNSTFKLTVNKKLLFNLGTIAQQNDVIKFELVYEDKSVEYPFKVLQTLKDDEVVGKGLFLLGKSKSANTQVFTDLGNNVCDFSNAEISLINRGFACQLGKVKNNNVIDIHLLEVEKPLTKGQSINKREYVFIKLAAGQDLANLMKQKKIYYHLVTTNTGRGVKTPNKKIEIDLLGVLTGKVFVNKNPIFVS